MPKNTKPLKINVEKTWIVTKRFTAKSIAEFEKKITEFQKNMRAIFDKIALKKEEMEDDDEDGEEFFREEEDDDEDVRELDFE